MYISALLTGLKVGAAYQNSVKIFMNILSEEIQLGKKSRRIQKLSIKLLFQCLNVSFLC